MFKHQLFLFLAVVFGVLLALVFQSFRKRGIKFLLTFSGAYLLGIGVFHLLPEVYEEHSHHYGLMIMAGFFVQLILEAFSKGVEHGHSHSNLFKKNGLPLGVLISLFLHAFLESLPIGGETDQISKEALLWGLLVHKVPVSFILFTMTYTYTKNIFKLSALMLLFALIAPFGVWVGDYLPLLTAYSKELTAFVFGIFLHISTTILFESSESHRFNFYKLFVILIALGVAWLSVSHHH